MGDFFIYRVCFIGSVDRLLGNEQYWAQSYPFDYETTFYKLTESTDINTLHAGNVEDNEQYPVGCGPLSVAQLFHYLIAKKNPVSLSSPTTIFSVQQNFALGQSKNNFYINRKYSSLIGSDDQFLTLAFTYPRIQTSYNIEEMSCFHGDNMTPAVSAKVSQYISPMIRDIGIAFGATYDIVKGTATTLNNINNVFNGLLEFPSNTSRYVMAPGFVVPGHNPVFYSIYKKTINNTIITNLDLGFPVLLALDLTSPYEGGHASIVDGYAFDMLSTSSSTPYFHIVSGWSSHTTSPDVTGNWIKDEGTWSYGLTTLIRAQREQQNINYEITPFGIAYNLFRDLSTISSDQFIDYAQMGVLKPVVFSGRIVKPNQVKGMRPIPVINAEISIAWGLGGSSWTEDSNKYTVKTNGKGIFACIVDGRNRVALKVTSPDISFYKIEYKTVEENTSYTGNVGELDSHIANEWLADLVPLKIAAATSQYETASDQSAMFVSKGMSEGEKYIAISKDALATADLSYLGDGVLFIGSDPAFDYNGNYDTDTVINVMQFVRNGGTVVTSGKSTAFPGMVGFSKGLRFYSFSGLPKPYGATKSISTRVSAWANHIKQYMHGQDTFNMVSALSARDHSLISDPGNTSAFAIGTYVFESMIWGPWGPELDYNLTYVPAGTTIEYGDNGGKLIYINGEFSLNHAEGGLARDFVNALIDPILFKADDEESLSDAVGGEYGALGGQPVAMNSLNLKSVVYNNGVTVNNIATSDDVSFVFTVTDRIADSSAPDLVVSDDAVPTLTVSLRNPAGEVVAAKQTPTSADNTLAFALSGDAAVAGEWKMVVENVYGFDGRRVVVAASITGDYDIGDAVTLPPPSNAAMAMHPRGAAGDTFSYQLGDGTMTLSDTGLRKLALGTLVKPEYLDFTRVDDDLVVRIKGGLNKIKLPGWFKRMGSDFFEVTFAGGRKLSGREVKKLAVVREPEIDITPLMIEERLRGTDGRDSLSGKTKNAFLFAGKGDDAISGGSGDNVYYYRKGDGNDTITLGDKKNVLRFHLEIEPEEVTAARDGGDMVFDLDGGSVRIKDWFRGSKLTRIEFPGGVVWDDRDVEKLAAGKKLTPREYYLAPPAEPKAEGLPAGTGGGCNSGIPVVSLMSVAVGWAVVRRRKR